MPLGGPQGDEEPPAPGYWWDGVQWQPPKSDSPPAGSEAPPPPPAPAGTTDPNTGLTQGKGGGQPVAPPSIQVGGQNGGFDAFGGFGTPGGTQGLATANAGQTVDTLKNAATPVTRAAPQVTTPDAVIASGATAEKPTAVTAATAAPITAGTVTAPTIAPIERINAATVAAGPQAVAGQVGPTTIATDEQRQFRTRQQSLTDALEAAAAGTAPTAGELAARQQAQDAANEQRSLAAGVHGYGGLAAIRQAGRNISNIQSKAMLDQALLRQKGVEDARAELGTLLGQAREQDIGLASKQADLTQGAGVTNANLTTQVSISNADREAARLKTNAELQQDAAKGDAAAQNELNERDAANKLAAGTTSATLALDAAKSNQNTETTTNLANAANATQTNIVGATEANKVALANQEEALKAQLANADNQTKVALANAGFTLEGRQIDDAQNVAAIKNWLEAQSQYLTSADQIEKNELARKQLDEALKRGDRDFTLGVITSILGAAGAVGAGVAKSDRDAKTGIKKASGRELDDLLSAMEAWTYRYKDPKDGGGKRTGPMAQELERSMLGKSMVRKGPDGDKVVDTGALTMALAGAVARMAKQQRRAQGGA